jgi:hypothetical protein
LTTTLKLWFILFMKNHNFYGQSRFYYRSKFNNLRSQRNGRDLQHVKSNGLCNPFLRKGFSFFSILALCLTKFCFLIRLAFNLLSQLRQAYCMKLVVSQHVWKTGLPLPCVQLLATGPYSQPHESNLNPPFP